MEVYSQDEIDQFLSAINCGDVEPDDFRPSAYSRKIKIYDFKRPDRFSGYIGEIKAIHDELARLWTNSISRSFQMNIHFHCASIDMLSYEEFVRSVPSPTFFMIAQGFLDSVPLPRSFVIEVDPDLSIEQSTLNEISKSMLNEYSLIWNKHYDMKMEFSLKATETDSRYLDVDLPWEMGALITIEAILNDTEGKINIYLPYLFMKPLLPYLTRVRSRESFDENFNQEEDIMDNRYKSAIETGLDKVKVQVIVELGRAVKTLKEIHETKEGTIMSIDTFAGEPADIFVNNVLFGRGEIVVLGENFGVRFTEIVGQEEKGSDANSSSDQPSAPNADGELKAEE